MRGETGSVVARCSRAALRPPAAMSASAPHPTGRMLICPCSPPSSICSGAVCAWVEVVFATATAWLAAVSCGGVTGACGCASGARL